MVFSVITGIHYFWNTNSSLLLGHGLLVFPLIFIPVLPKKYKISAWCTYFILFVWAVYPLAGLKILAPSAILFISFLTFDLILSSWLKKYNTVIIALILLTFPYWGGWIAGKFSTPLISYIILLPSPGFGLLHLMGIAPLIQKPFYNNYVFADFLMEPPSLVASALFYMLPLFLWITLVTAKKIRVFLKKRNTLQ